MAALPDLNVVRVHAYRRQQPLTYSDPEHVLTCVLGGSCDYRIADRLYHVGPGHVICLRPHLPHLIVPRSAGIHHLCVHPVIAAAGTWVERIPEVVLLRGRRRQQVQRWFADLMQVWDDGSGQAADVCAGLAGAVLATLADAAAEPARPVTGRGWALVERAIRTMHLRHGEGLDAAGIARALAVSPAHLSRAFVAHAGLGPARFLLDIRLDRARELLHRHGLPCAEVARRCGFGSASAFSRAFRQRLGLAPSAWLTRTLAARTPPQ